MSGRETLDMLRDINLASILLRIALALVVGGVLGLERGRKNRPAGFRTYMLVCLGAALVMMTNQYVYQQFATSDPARMGAQVISGIGFLGAGTIIVTGKSQIRGITTAASLWTAACSGLAIGIGFYEGAILGGITIYLVMTVMRHIDAYIHSHSNIIDLYLELEGKGAFGQFIGYARENGFDIVDVQLSKNKLAGDRATCVVLSAHSSLRRTHVEMAEILNGAPGVMYLHEL